jgi:uncharacterized protein involved in exopolysaccharide biosynthesis
VARREEIESRRRTTEAGYEALLTRMRDTEASAGYRGERLKLVDPGIIPEQPSSPRLVLNVGAAVLLGLVLSLLYVTIRFVYAEDRRPGAAVRGVRQVSAGRD